MMSLILAAAMTLSLNTDTCILETTVLTSTIEEFNMINNFMVKAEYTEDMLYTNSGIVLFFNEARDTVLVREVSNGCDETYRLLINTND
mgnify:CR=1 FL=1